MKIIGNIIWLIFGFIMALGYYIAGVLSCITIIGIGNGIQSFKLGNYSMWPFGYTVRESPSGGGCLSTIGNVIWFLVGGIWLAVGHVIIGLLFCIPIVTIPFGQKHFELAKLAIAPYGKEIVKTD